MADLEKRIDYNPFGAANEYTSDASSDDHTDHLEKGYTKPGCAGCGPTSKEDRGKESGGLVKNGKHEIDEDEYQDALGFAFPAWKKWWILTVIFIVQCSMNFNASVIGNAVNGVSAEYQITVEKTRAIQGGFLIAYGFGCELWAPFSEEFGRWLILQLSLGLVNLWQIPCALTRNFPMLVAFRVLGGLSSAGGSVTLGMIADIFQADEQQWAVLYVVMSSVGGSVLGPIFGGLMEQHLGWRWNFWIQLIFGGATQILHFFTVPETRATVMLDKKAKRLRKEDDKKFGHIYGPNEMKEHRLDRKELLSVWYRPFKFFFTEPIVLCLSLLSGFSDALIFTFLEAYAPVYEQWHFSTSQVGAAFIPIVIGYCISYATFVPDVIMQVRQRKEKGSNNVRPERRLLFLLSEAPLEAIGLFGFAFTSYGPMVMTAKNSWIAPMIFSTFVGMANFAIYYTTIDYMIAAYGPYSASATGGNGFARDVLAGIAAFYAGPMYGVNEANGIDRPHNLVWGSALLGVFAIFVTIPIYVFYWKGEWFRNRSKYAQTLASGRDERGGRRMSSIVF